MIFVHHQPFQSLLQAYHAPYHLGAGRLILLNMTARYFRSNAVVHQAERLHLGRHVQSQAASCGFSFFRIVVQMHAKIRFYRQSVKDFDRWLWIPLLRFKNQLMQFGFQYFTVAGGAANPYHFHPFHTIHQIMPTTNLLRNLCQLYITFMKGVMPVTRLYLQYDDPDYAAMRTIAYADENECQKLGIKYGRTRKF